jgi:surface protein
MPKKSNVVLTQALCDEKGKDYNPITKKCVAKCGAGKIREQTATTFKCIAPPPPPLNQASCDAKGKDYNPITKKCVAKCGAGKIRELTATTFKCIAPPPPPLNQASCDAKGKDYNPFTRKCVAKCASGKRGPNFKCIPKKKGQTMRSPQRNASRQNAPQQNAPQRNAPQQNTSRQNASRQNAPQQNASRQNTSRQNTSQQQNASRQNTSRQNTSQQQNAPRQNAPQQNAPQQNAPQQNAPQQNAPQQNASRQNAPRQQTNITNANIHNFVNLYITSKNQLPEDLRDVDINDWNVSSVTDMSSLFEGQALFYEPLDRWDVSNVKNMRLMFKDCSRFNQPLNNWNVSNVENMSNMFMYCRRFNQPLNDWNVSHVNNMEGMFTFCTDFNQPLNKWDVSNVLHIRGMFTFCTKFNQVLTSWRLNNNVDILQPASMFMGTSNLPPENYPRAPGADRHGGPGIKPILATQIPTIAQPINIPSDATAFDVTDIEEKTLTPAFLKEYFEDNDHILCFQNNKFYFSNRSDLKDAIDVNKQDNSIIFVCKNVMNKFVITINELRNETPYLNLQGVGMYGYVPASEIQYIINDTENQLYILTDTQDNAPTVVAWGVYKYPGTNIVGRSHCQDGRSGQIFNLSIGKLRVNGGGWTARQSRRKRSHSRRRRTNRTRRNKSLR